MAYDDYYRQLMQQGGGANTGMGPVQQALSQYSDTGSAYDPMSRSYNQGALGNQGFFIPSGMGTQGQQTYGQQSPVASAMQSYYQQPGMGGGAGQIGQMMGQGAGTQDLATQMALQQQQFGLGQQGAEAKMGRAQATAKQLGLDPSTASSMAEQMASVQDLPVQREKEAAMQAIRNQLARGGMGISSEGDRLTGDVLGSTAAQERSNRTMAEIQMKQWMTQALASILGRGI